MFVFKDDCREQILLRKGERVLVVGTSPRRGHLMVEYQNKRFHIPYQYLHLAHLSLNKSSAAESISARRPLAPVRRQPKVEHYYNLPKKI